MASAQLLVFDSRRGNREGEEIQKILAFHPADTPPVEQITTAGLLHGLLLFSSNFSQGFWEVAETDKSTWVVHQAEPSIWFALAAPRTWIPRHCTEGNLRAVLVQAYQIISLLHGSIEGLLQQDPSGQQAQRAVLPLLDHLGRQLSNPLAWQHRQLRNPLVDVSLAPLLRLSPPTSLALHNFCSAVQLTSLGGSRSVEGVMVLHQQHVLWSGLAPADTAAVYALASTALLHPQSTLTHRAGGEAREPSMFDSNSWHQLPSKYVVLREGCYEDRQQQQAAEEEACVPTVLIQSGQERCHLLPYKEGKLWVVLLVSAGVALTQHVLATLQAAIALPAQQLAAQAGQEIRSTQTEAGHVPGYRYMYCDHGSSTVVATPRVKISAMLHHSRALAASVRESLARLEPPKHSGGGSSSRACPESAAGTAVAEGSPGIGQHLEESSRWPQAAAAGGGWQDWQHEERLVQWHGASADMHAKWLTEQLEGDAPMEPPSPPLHRPPSPVQLGALVLQQQEEGGGTGSGRGQLEPAQHPHGSSTGETAEGDGVRSKPGRQREAVEELGQGLDRLGVHPGQAQPSEAASSTCSSDGGAGAKRQHAPGREGSLAEQANHTHGAEGLGEQAQELHSSGSRAAASAAETVQALHGAQDACTEERAAAAGQFGPGHACCMLSSTATARAEAEGEATPAVAVGANDVYEVFARSSQECWAAARAGLRSGREVLVVRERKTERNLGEALGVMDAFVDGFMC